MKHVFASTERIFTIRINQDVAKPIAMDDDEEVGVLPEGLPNALRSIAGPFLWRHPKSPTKLRSLPAHDQRDRLTGQPASAGLASNSARPDLAPQGDSEEQRPSVLHTKMFGYSLGVGTP
jgi:hypothetical protein